MTKGHRPPLPPEKVALIRRMASEHVSQRAIGRIIGVSYTTVKKYSRDHTPKEPKYQHETISTKSDSS